MATNQEVLEWATSVGQQALTESRGGDATLANKIGSNSAFQMFFNNVIALKHIPGPQFIAGYPSAWKEITRLYESYLRDETVNETISKVSTLEGKIDKLEGLIMKLLENAQPTAVVDPAASTEIDEDEEETTPVKTKKKQPVKAEIETEATPEGEPTPESEA